MVNAEQHYYVYILKSVKDDKLYTGYTGDLKKRLLEHESGKVKSTRNRRPMKLGYVKRFASRIEAVRFERYLKSPQGGPTKKKLVSEFDNGSFKM